MSDTSLPRFVLCLLLTFSLFSPAAETSCPFFYEYKINSVRYRYETTVFKERHRSRKGADMRISSKRSKILSDQLTRDISAIPVFQDKWIVPLVKKNLQRTSNHSHTLNLNDYINRHLSKELIDPILNDDKIKIDIISGSLKSAIAHLRSESFDRIEILPTYSATDYFLLLGYSSKTNETRLVINTLNGQSYLQEAVAQLLYYSVRDSAGKVKTIDPKRVRVFSDGNRPKDIFLNILKKEKLDPDIVVIGQKTEISRWIKKEGRELKEKCEGVNLCFLYFEINGKKILSVSIEPYLYGDRSGDFVSAVQSIDPKRRAFIFIGTAGSLSNSIPLGSYVAPSWHRHSDHDSSVRIPYENHAIEVLNPSEFASVGVFKGQLGQVAVDSILYEDKGWMKVHAKEENNEGASIVEQEGFGIIEAIQSRNDLAYMVYRISDSPVNGEDFSKKPETLQGGESLHSMQMNLIGSAIKELDR